MDNARDILSKFKKCLDDVIVDYKNKISEIDKKQEFIVTLGDVVNYSKSDYLLLPFYDEEVLVDVFEHVFPLSNTEINKVKTAKYLIESCKSVDTSNFPQYNETIKELEVINKKVSDYYDNLLSDTKLNFEKDELSVKVDSYLSILNLIDVESFNGLIENIDLFEDSINLCNFSNDDVNVILNIAIKSNLRFLDSNGIIVDDSADIADLKEQNNIFQDKISDLSNLLDGE